MGPLLHKGRVYRTEGLRFSAFTLCPLGQCRFCLRGLDRSPSLSGGFGNGSPASRTEPAFAFRWRGCGGFTGCYRIQHLPKFGDLRVDAFLLGFETIDGGENNFFRELGCVHESVSRLNSLMARRLISLFR
jgi:hypothetical protein